MLLGCDFFLRYAAMLAGGLERAGARVAVLNRDHDEEFGGVAGAAGRFAAGATAAPRFVVPGRVRSRRGFGGALRARRAVRGFAPDVVHLQEGVGNDPRLLFAAGARPGSFALTVHDPTFHPGEGVSRGRALGNRALVRAAGLIFVHADALRQELARVARPRAPIVVVPHGVDSGEAAPLPADPSVLFFGRFGHYKGIDVLLDAMQEVWTRLPEATLTIAGNGELEDHPALADPRVRLRREHVPDEEVPELFSAARCVALPYRQASQSGVGSLAKSAGRALVVTEVGGLPELVSDGSGLSVPPGDSPALGAALVRVLEDERLAAELGGAGRASAIAGADWRSVGELTLTAYREHLLGQGTGG